MLSDCGIDQATWLAFLDNFDRASVASPWLHTLNVAAFGISFVPHGIGLALSIVMDRGSKFAIEMQGRKRSVVLS